MKHPLLNRREINANSGRVVGLYFERPARGSRVTGPLR